MANRCFPRRIFQTPADTVKSVHSILIVEDEEVLLEVLAHRFLKAGYSVHTATDGAKACEKIGKRRPDLILMDIMLPHLSGLEVLNLLRQDKESKTARTPVIMVTAQTSPESMEQSLQLGADSFFYKPYSISDLIHCAGSLINS